MTLSLADGAQTGNRRTSRVNANFTAVKHSKSKNIAVFNRPSTNDFGEMGQANPKQFSRLSPFEGVDALSLFFAQCVIAHRFERLIPRRVIIAAVVFPSQCGLIGKLVFLYEIDTTQFRGIHVQFDRKNFDHPFYEIGGFRDAEGTAIRHTARRLIGIDAVNCQIGCRNVVRACADVHKAGGKFGWISTGVKTTMISCRMTPKPSNFTLFRCRDFALHPIITCKSCGHQIVHPVFDPLHRFARYN